MSGRNLLGYHDKIWEPYMQFQYTGDFEEFTLPAGEYLLECDGAPGGMTNNYSEPLYGGTTYGVLNISEPKTLYAAVGGIGENGSLDSTIIGHGGWNGGGDGGEPVSGYGSGAGGGGATDIRASINPDEIIEYDVELDTTKYEFLDYCITDRTNGGAVHTDYYHAQNTYVEYDCNLTGSDPRNYGSLFGARNSAFHEAFSFFYRFAGRDRGCLMVGSVEQEGPSSIQAPYGQRVLYKINTTKAEWYDTNDTKLGEITNTATYSPCNWPCLIFDTNDGSDFEDGSFASLTFYSMKIYEDGTLKRYYIPAQTKAIDITSEFNLSWEQGTIGSSGNQNSTTRVRTPGYIQWSFRNRPRSLRMYAKDINGNDLDWNIMEYTESNGYISDDGWVSSGDACTVYGHCANIRFCLKYPNGSAISPSDIGIVTMEYVAGEVGLYEVMTQTFAQSVKERERLNLGSCHLTAGNVIPDTTVRLRINFSESLASRIIVAGGGGGQMWMTEDTGKGMPSIGYGGGEYGGSPVYSGNNAYKYPTQSEGYSFGTGQTPPRRTGGSSWNCEGPGGGGGGWYGGYSAAIINSAYTSTNGGGGSGYVLTPTSYRPYPAVVYEPDSDLELTDTFLGVGTSAIPKIIIYKQIQSVVKDDVITFPCIGRSEHIVLNPGKYEFECYGGDGGFRLYHYANPTLSKGGYAAGTFETFSTRQTYVTVGGSGLFANLVNSDWVSKYNPTLTFNGGGQAGSPDSQATAGGGGTDIRLDTNSLYSRIIVAGGAGSEGRVNSIGGQGGGETGTRASWDTCGYTPGPGTQTESPYDSSHPDVCGGFGYGGNGKFASSGYGGAGGGGWYGGSGTYPDGSADDDEGGCGGSGYVLLPTSYKPTGYLLTNPDDCLTNTSLVTGGNDLPRGWALARIRVLGLKSKMLCSDMNLENFYGFNEQTSEWEIFKNSLPTDEDFDTYGAYTVTSDAGLPNNFKVLLKTNTIPQSVSVSVVPKEQTIRSTIEDDMKFGSYKIDMDEYDDEVFDVNCVVTRDKSQSENLIITDLNINKSEESNKKLKIYTVDIFNV